MSKTIRLSRKVDFQNTLYTKSINIIIDITGPSIILRSIYWFADSKQGNECTAECCQSDHKLPRQRAIKYSPLITARY